MIDAILALMPHTVTVRHHTGTQTVYGEEVYGPPVTYTAYVKGTTRRVQSEDGQEQQVNHEVYLAADEPFSSRDQLTIPEGFGPTTTVPIVKVDRHQDPTGIGLANVVLLCG